ncbi:MAG: hypothetical protein ABFS03_11865 [Chloroflexota bacterium]
MPISADTMRLLLLGCILSLNILAAFYLRSRKLSLWALTSWGIICLVLPVVGSFVLIWSQPGQHRTKLNQ